MSIFDENPTVKLGNTVLGGADDSAPPLTVDTPKKKRGRPKGSKNRPKDETGKPIDVETEKIPAGEKFRYQYDEKTVQAAGRLLGTLWYLLSPYIKARPLTDEEKKLLGEDAAPLIQKYVPIYDDWKYEINFGMTIIGLYQLARKDWEKEHKGEENAT